ncbi:MAG: Flp pilus assembly complex ATPase component TadA, partial [Thiomargarita sp.]|nr:Flp pilus assembly complex ATPase component TadA [Thiomargarita sp.]
MTSEKSRVPNKAIDITRYLKLVIENNASDIYFTVGSPVRFKISKKITNVGKSVLTANMIEAIARNIMTEEQWTYFEKELDLDFAISMTDSKARFRANAFRQQGHVSLVMRYVKGNVPSMDQMNLPVILKELILKKRGLILMVGATNSGKSTTLGAMLDHRNANQAGHILTIEDPIEFVHPHKKSLVNQRELGVDTHTYLRALRASMRESPDV